MKQITDRLHSWASLLEPNTLEQAEALSRLPIIEGHVALMPDAHLGKGSTVGSVIPTKGAVIPAAIGVDIGCGMVAARTDRSAADLPDALDPFVVALEQVVPAGLGRWHAEPKDEALEWYAEHPNPRLTSEQEKRAVVQLGTMGSVKGSTIPIASGGPRVLVNQATDHVPSVRSRSRCSFGRR